MDSWRTTSPLKLAEMTAFTLPLPSYFSIPAMANGFWLFPVTSTPSWANRYVPCSVALEHFAPASFSSSANPLPTASTPTRPTTPNTTNRAARYLFMRSVPPCCVLAGTLWQVVSRCNEHSVPTYVPFCSGQSAGHWSKANANKCAWVCTDGGYLGGAKEHCDRSRCQIRLRIPSVLVHSPLLPSARNHVSGGAPSRRTRSNLKLL